jgi:hypothetical protein
MVNKGLTKHWVDVLLKYTEISIKHKFVCSVLGEDIVKAHD